jgi:hypothetical protein
VVQDFMLENGLIAQMTGVFNWMFLQPVHNVLELHFQYHGPDCDCSPLMNVRAQYLRLLQTLMDSSLSHPPVPLMFGRAEVDAAVDTVEGADAWAKPWLRSSVRYGSHSLAALLTKLYEDNLNKNVDYKCVCVTCPWQGVRF